MNIERDTDINKWLGDTLEEMRNHTHAVIEHKCLYCGHATRFPLIARQTDVEMFEALIESAHKVMNKHGITANLLADIRAQCYIEIAKRGKG